MLAPPLRAGIASHKAETTLESRHDRETC